MSAITKIEAIATVDQRRPTQMSSLPGWLVSLRGSMATNLQIDPATGRFADLLTIPADRMPTDQQRTMIADHIRSLNLYLIQTPQNDDAYEGRTIVAVTKLLLVLSLQKTSEQASDARAEAYMAALDDVPYWAVEEAIRKWYRSEYGADHNYSFAPDPAVLRKVAQIEAMRLQVRIADLERVLSAQPRQDHSKQLAEGRAAMKGLNIVRAMDDPDAVKSLTFDKAVKLGQEAAE